MKSIIVFFRRYWNGLGNHISTALSRPLFGSVGHNTFFRKHGLFKGDCLDKVSIGDHCDFDSFAVIECSSRIIVNGQKVIPELTIGNGCVFGEYNHITAVNRIIIGENLLTGRFVLITDNSHGSFAKEELYIHPSSRQIFSKGEVIIGNNVWLGDKVSILPGVHIGDGCVIGANSVVTHDIPPYCMAAGIPAVVIRRPKPLEDNNHKLG